MVVDLAAGDHRHNIVKEVDDRADESGLRLAALAQQDQVVAREDPSLEPGEHGVLEAEDPGEQLLTELEMAEQVGPKLLFDGSVGVSGGAELAERRRVRHADQGNGGPAKGLSRVDTQPDPPRANDREVLDAAAMARAATNTIMYTLRVTSSRT